jgi:membrane-bound lytic murein transglycosylase F
LAQTRLLPILLALLLAGCSQAAGLEQLQQEGKLRVALRQLPTAMHDDHPGPAGFQYAIAQRFAEHLGVELVPVVTEDIERLKLALDRNEVDIGAFAVPVTKRRSRELHFSRAFHRARPYLLYRYGQRRPKSLDELDGTLAVAFGDGHAEQLERLAHAHPGLAWQVDREHPVLELLKRVAEGELDYTIAYSHEIDIARQLYPDLRIAFHVGEDRDFAWALPDDADDALVFRLQEFFDELESSGLLQVMLEQYFGHLDDFDFVEMREFQRRIDARLPDYRALFEAAAGDDLDWRLLAAISYQESHWDPDARSPTGVRGLMMLTHGTAKQLGVEDRTDPEESIHGGADYLRWVKGKIPSRIDEPDRTWLALATYNIGFGHLEDARRLTQRNGGNPDLWSDVRRNLPLLAKEKWYSQTRHGQARGGEAVAYVEKVRAYYDVLSRRLQLEQQRVDAKLVKAPRITPLAF